MMPKKTLTILFAITLIGALINPAGAAQVPDEQFVISGPTNNQPSLGVVIEDSQFLKNTFSTLQAFTSDGTQQGKSNVTSVKDCFEFGTPGCDSSKFFNFMANLGFCSVGLTTDCVQGVTAVDSSGKSLTVNYLSAFPEKMDYAYKGDKSVNLPTGGSTFLVDIPGAKHPGGTQYLIVAQMAGRKDFDSINFITDRFSLGIFAVSKVLGRYRIAGPASDLAAFRLLGMVSNTRIPFDKSANQNAGCAQSSETECLLAWPLPLDIQFGITVKAHSPVNGWLHGRTNNTIADISRTADGDQLISVSGKASIVPGVYAWFPKSNLPKKVADYYSDKPEGLKSGTGFGVFDPITGTGDALLKDNFEYRENQFPEALAWYSALQDKAPMAPTQWSIRSANSGDDQKGCYGNKLELSGIVATNSNFFVSGPPTYNKVENSLDYKVASPHYLPNGKVFKGTYNLVMKSSVARCIYGFTDAPVSATVSVVAADGTSQVATTVLGEKSGWLYLSASGFTFSSPTVRVKLTQAGSKIAPTIVKKTSITCIKGDSTKKVIAVNPKCPAGYKKK
jgi:hypothetical protein